MTDEFENMKKRYAGYSMDDKAVNEMKNRMVQAEFENKMAKRKSSITRWAVAAAAALTIFILPNSNAGVANAMGNIPGIGGFFQLITLREYYQNDGRNEASVAVSGLKSDNKTAKKTADDVNKEIKELTDKYVQEFKDTKRMKGHEALDVDTKVIDKTDKYFTLKLSRLTTAGDSYQENHYYTISLETGKQIKLADLFKSGSDYKTVLLKNVESQMEEQVKNSDEVAYFYTDSKNDEGLDDFKESDLTDKASFYLNKDGNIVICYNQGDAAPMYMGALEFVIPNSAVKDILK